MSSYHADMSAGESDVEIAAARLDVLALRLLAGIAQTSSLGEASRRLGLAQPNASRMLTRLERDLGLRLVERGPRGSTLTADGRLVVEWSAPAFAALDRLVVGTQALQADAATQLSVGASLTIGEHLAPNWLSAFRTQHPQVQVRLQVMNSADVVAALTEARLDLGFIETPDVPPGLQSCIVARDELVLVTHPGHPWARRSRSVPLHEVAATPLVVREPGSGTRRTVDELFSGAGATSARPVMELSSTEAIIGSVVAGAGPAIVSTLAVEGARRAGRLVIVPIEGVKLDRSLRAVWRPGRRLTGPAGDFVLQARSPS